MTGPPYPDDYDPYRDPNSDLYDPYADPNSDLYDPYLDPDAPWDNPDWDPPPDPEPEPEPEPVESEKECTVEKIDKNRCIEICHWTVRYPGGGFELHASVEDVPCPKSSLSA